MFQSARLKLTAWYLLILMTISILFSIGIYNISTLEIRRIIERYEQRQQLFDQIYPFSPRPLPRINFEALHDSEHRLIYILIVINSSILFLAGLASYFLAGRTLQPIQEMVDEQDRFITDASHELRTPLTVLRAEMESSLLDEKISTKDAKKLIASNLEEIISLQTLTDHLLTLAQHSSKQKKTPQSLNAIINKAIHKFESLAKKKQITITQSGTDVLLSYSDQKILELLMIFLDNAIKYSPDKSTVHITTEKHDKRVSIRIRDEGVGIAEEHIPHIFNRFYRSDAARSHPSSQGHGLGLSIAKKIVKEMNGSIQVESQEHLGTTFFIILPVQ